MSNGFKYPTANNCHQMLSVLESMENGPVPFVLLDLLRTFTYTNVDFKERRDLLKMCLEQLDRLAKSSGGLVSVHIPNVLCQVERELLDMVIVAAGKDLLPLSAISHSFRGKFEKSDFNSPLRAAFSSQRASVQPGVGHQSQIPLLPALFFSPSIRFSFRFGKTETCPRRGYRLPITE